MKVTHRRARRPEHPGSWKDSSIHRAQRKKGRGLRGQWGGLSKAQSRPVREDVPPAHTRGLPWPSIGREHEGKFGLRESELRGPPAAQGFGAQQPHPLQRRHNSLSTDRTQVSTVKGLRCRERRLRTIQFKVGNGNIHPICWSCSSHYNHPPWVPLPPGPTFLAPATASGTRAQRWSQ